MQYHCKILELTKWNMQHVFGDLHLVLFYRLKLFLLNDLVTLAYYNFIFVALYPITFIQGKLEAIFFQKETK